MNHIETTNQSNPKSWLMKTLHSVLRLGAGELIARLTSFAVVAYISRRYGLELLGALALAQTVTTYLIQGTDQGFRLIGARLVARDANFALTVVPAVTRKKATAGLICVAAGLAYALCGPMPTYSRLCVAGFVLAILPYALSLDWLAWGLSHFGWMGSWRAGIGLIFMAGSFIGFRFISDPRLSLVGANMASIVAGSFVLWLVWRLSWRKHLRAAPVTVDDCAHELRWSAALSLGLATILTQMFHNADTLLLGAMAPLSEVGRYSAAYKFLFLICSGFYLLTQSMFPRLAAASGGGHVRKLLLLALGAVALAGTLIAAVLWVFARQILAIVYGSDLGAIHLLRILVFAIPMDFVAALLGISLISRGFDRFLLFACGLAAACNIAVNLVLIPRMRADGAAIATIVSYVLIDLILLAGYLCKPVFMERIPSVHANVGQD